MPGTSVEVRSTFTNTWVGGFVVAEHVLDGCRLWRMADGAVLEPLFHWDELRLPGPVVPAGATTRRYRVLVVDDETDVRELLAVTLSGLGAVKAAGDAYQALELLRNEPFDVVVLDVMMPGASGLDLMERMERLDLATPVVVVTAWAGGDIDSKARSAGAKALVAKPFARSDLLQAVVSAAAA